VPRVAYAASFWDSPLAFVAGLRCLRSLARTRQAIRPRGASERALFSSPIHLPSSRCTRGRARAPVVIVLRKRSTARDRGERGRWGVGWWCSAMHGLDKRAGHEPGTIDISPRGPNARYNKAWARSNRAGQVRGQALSVNQGK